MDCEERHRCQVFCQSWVSELGTQTWLLFYSQIFLALGSFNGIDSNQEMTEGQPYSRQKFLRAKTFASKGLPLQTLILRRGNSLWLPSNETTPVPDF